MRCVHDRRPAAPLFLQPTPANLLRALFALAVCAALEVRAAPPLPPDQPASGPGGAAYPHAEVLGSKHGKGAAEFWLFEPLQPKPVTAPVIVFSHGWGAVDPAPYRAWIDHLARRGNIVIYPRYQVDDRTPPRDFTPNSIAAVRAALDLLTHDAARVRPDPGRFALVGHSAGGVVSANVAALAARTGLPVPRAVLSAAPGRTWGLARRSAVALEDLSAIPAGTLLVAVAGDRDRIARTTDARRIYYESARVPAENKNFVIVQSDSYGSPPLEAHHFAPLARSGAPAPAHTSGRAPGQLRERLGERRRARGDASARAPGDEDPDERLPNVGGVAGTTPDALDFYGYWKLFDGLTDAAFHGKNRHFALGDTPQQRYMGVWSDGRAVRELVIRERP